MKKLFTFLTTLFIINNTHSQTPNINMLKDISLSAGAHTRNYATYNNNMYFSANDGVHGFELWVTDGTTAATQMLKDIYPGSAGSTPQYLVVCNGKLFFTANDGIHGYELWISDGTTAGTQLLKDIKLGYNDSYPVELTVYNNKIVFNADDSIHAIEPWISDGTAAGTQMLRDINQDPSYQNSDPMGFKVYNNKIYFSANDQIHSTELWVTDGTTIGTVMVKDINTSTFSASDPAHFTIYNGLLYFKADPFASNMDAGQLWVTDGTAAGTSMVKNVNPGQDAVIDQVFVYNNKIYFAANNATSGREVWISDGTTAGTMLFKDIYPGASGSFPFEFTFYAGKFYFQANDGVNGLELWVSDGTSAGTMLFKDMNPGSPDGGPGHFIIFGSKLFFTGSDAPNGTELWVSDGTVSGTHNLIPTLATGPAYTDPLSCFDGFCAYKTALYFNAEYDTHDCELWRFDTVATTGIKQFNINKIRANVYPNPGSGIFYLQLNQYENIGVEIYNIMGQKILTKTINTNKTEINIIDFKSGIYELRVLQNEQPVYQTKLLKQE